MNLALLEKIVGKEGLTQGTKLDSNPIINFTPLATLRPLETKKVSNVLRECSESGLGVVPHGGGTMLEAGKVPNKESVFLDLRSLTQVFDHRAEDLTVRLSTGFTVKELNSKLSKKGQRLGIDIPGSAKATIGGAVSSGAAGLRRISQGTLRDSLLGVEAVMADGTVVRGGGQVMKNVAGYDLPKLFSGSFGTIGILTEVVLKTNPLPESEGWFMAEFDGMDNAWSGCRALKNAGIEPASCDVVGSASSMADAPWNKIPVSGQGVWALYGFEGRSTFVDHQLEIAMNCLEDYGKSHRLEGDEAGKTMDLLANMAVNHEFPVCLRGAALENSIPHILKIVTDWALENDCRFYYRAHGFSEMFDMYLMPGPKLSPALLSRGLEKIRGLCEGVESMGPALGSLRIVRVPVEVWNQIDIYGGNLGARSLVKSIKSKLDPRNILNPGRFV